MGGRHAIGIVGAGRAGLALALASGRAGWAVAAISSRDPRRRASLARQLPGVTVVATPREVAAASDLVLLAVPDDAMVATATVLDARLGSIVAHLSGVHPAAVLRGAVPPGVLVGSFHPLVAFADAERSVSALREGYVAIDGDARAVEALEALALALGARPVTLMPAGDPAIAKAAYHAAAVLAAGGFVALLDVIAELGRMAGLDEATSVAVYGSLVRQGLDNAHELGVAAALTGPVVRGDAGTLAAHLEAIGAVAPGARELYLGAAHRQLALAREHGLLDAARAEDLDRLLDAARAEDLDRLLDAARAEDLDRLPGRGD